MSTAAIVAWLLAHASCHNGWRPHTEICRVVIDQESVCYIDKLARQVTDVNCFYHGGVK